MAKLHSKTLRFTPSESVDVVSYNVRIVADGTPFDYALPVSVIDGGVEEGGKITVDIGSMSVAPSIEGVYDVYVTAVDAGANESDPLIIENSAFDFNPPLAPTDGSIS